MLLNTLECFNDIDAQAELLAGYDQRYQQQGRGLFSGQFLTLRMTRQITLYFEYCSVSIFQQSAVPSGCMSIGFFLSFDTPCIMDGQTINADSVLLGTEGCAVDHVTAANMCMCVVNFPAATFADLLSPTTRTKLHVRAPAVVRRLRQLAQLAVILDSSRDSERRDTEGVAGQFEAVCREFVAVYGGSHESTTAAHSTYSRSLALIHEQLGSSIRIIDLLARRAARVIPARRQ